MYLVSVKSKQLTTLLLVVLASIVLVYIETASTSGNINAPNSSSNLRSPANKIRASAQQQQQQSGSKLPQQAIKNPIATQQKETSEERKTISANNNDNSSQQQRVTNLENSNGNTEARVVPSQESNGNSQVVYVNYARVVNDNNETTRVISYQPSQIKQEAQISCGETNKNGRPSGNNSDRTDETEEQLLNNRIVGGNKAEPGEFPYQARLNIRSYRGSSLCGAVIIDKRHILTAAHCVTTCSSYFVTTRTIDASTIQATIGDHRITVADGEVTIGIEKVIAHQQYSACSYSHNNYDIAILRTNKPMSWLFTKDGFGSINRVCLPHKNDEYSTGENATVTGWGVMREGEGTISNVLNAVDVPIVSYAECRQAYGGRVNQDHVCAGLKQGGKDSCQGDSGGPLVRTINGRKELIGIVSFGYGCAQPGSPGVYTKVSHYTDWIEKNM